MLKVALPLLQEQSALGGPTVQWLSYMEMCATLDYGVCLLTGAF